MKHELATTIASCVTRYVTDCRSWKIKASVAWTALSENTFLNEFHGVVTTFWPPKRSKTTGFRWENQKKIHFWTPQKNVKKIFPRWNHYCKKMHLCVSFLIDTLLLSNSERFIKFDWHKVFSRHRRTRDFHKVPAKSTFLSIFQLTLKKLQFLYFIGTRSFLEIFISPNFWNPKGNYKEDRNPLIRNRIFNFPSIGFPLKMCCPLTSSGTFWMPTSILSLRGNEIVWVLTVLEEIDFCHFFDVVLSDFVWKTAQNDQNRTLRAFPDQWFAILMWRRCADRVALAP